MEWIINQLRVHPELAIFLTLFAGFWLGRLKIGKFSLGTVTSVLLVGVLVGQLNITVDGPMKAVFFLLFLFAVGYKVVSLRPHTHHPLAFASLRVLSFLSHH